MSWSTVGFTETNKSLQVIFPTVMVVLPNQWMDHNGPGVVEVAYDGPS